jgi:hypothetical protein
MLFTTFYPPKTVTVREIQNFVIGPSRYGHTDKPNLAIDDLDDLVVELL